MSTLRCGDWSSATPSGRPLVSLRPERLLGELLADLAVELQRSLVGFRLLWVFMIRTDESSARLKVQAYRAPPRGG